MPRDTHVEAMARHALACRVLWLMSLPKLAVSSIDSLASPSTAPAQAGPPTGVEASCLIPKPFGCHSITDELTCIGSRDGREKEEWLGLRIHGEPCVWCGGQACRSGSSNKCEPEDFLLRGEGVGFTTFLARQNYQVAECKDGLPLPPRTGPTLPPPLTLAPIGTEEEPSTEITPPPDILYPIHFPVSRGGLVTPPPPPAVDFSSTVPPTAAPTTAGPPTEVPPTAAPTTAGPPTEVPPTAGPTTAGPPTEVPPTEVPPTEVPPTAGPTTAVPPTVAPPTRPPSENETFCLEYVPFEGGCSLIENKETCLQSRDNSSAGGSPCVWCGEDRCRAHSAHICDALHNLVNSGAKLANLTFTNCSSVYGAGPFWFPWWGWGLVLIPLCCIAVLGSIYCGRGTKGSKEEKKKRRKTTRQTTRRETASLEDSEAPGSAASVETPLVAGEQESSLFDLIDANHDGVITQSEFAQAMGVAPASIEMGQASQTAAPASPAPMVPAASSSAAAPAVMPYVVPVQTAVAPVIRPAPGMVAQAAFASPWLGATEVSSLLWLSGSVVAALVGHALLTPIGHRPSLLYCSLGRGLKGPTFSRFAPPLQWASVLLLLSPPILLARAAWIIAEDHWRVAALGCPIAVALYTASCGLLRFRADSFIWSRAAIAGLAGTALCLTAFFVLFVCLIGPFTFIGTSISMLCLSAAPSIALAFALLPWRSTSAVLAHLQGDAAEAGPALDERRRKQVVAGCLAASLVTLVAYAVVVMRLQPDASVRYVGFIVAAGVAVLDAMVWHLWRLGLVSGPLETSLLMVVARVAACIWGEHMWLLGHSGVAFAAGVLLSHVAVDCWLPRPDSPEMRRQERAEQVLGLLESSLSSQPSTATGLTGSTGASAAGAPGPAMVPDRPAVGCREHPGWLLLALVIAFSAEVGVTWIPAVAPSLELRSVSVCDVCASRPQNYYGVVALLAVLAYALSLAVLRRAQWAACRREGPLLAVAWRTILPTYGVWLGLAAFISYVADTWVVLVNAGFLPGMICLFYESYRNWVADDFKLPRGPGASAAVAPDPGGAAAEEGRGGPAPGSDPSGAAPDPASDAVAPLVGPESEPSLCQALPLRWWRSIPWTVRAWTVDLLLLGAYGAALQAVLTEERRWIAWTASVAVLVLAVSFLSNRAWFGTLCFNIWQWGCWLFVGLTLLIWALGVWQIEGGGNVDYFALTLLLVVLLYPALYSTILAFEMLRDAEWAPKDQFTQKFVRIAFGVSGVLYLAFLGMLVGLGFLAEAFCALSLAGLGVAFGAAVWGWRRGGGYLPRHHRRLVAAGFTVWVLLGAVVLAVVQESIFGGFSVACVGAALVFGCKAWLDRVEAQRRPPLRQLRVPSDWFFPAFRIGSTGELKSGHAGVVSMLLTLQTVALWGLVASAALQDVPYVGAVVAALALTASFLLLCRLVSEGGAGRAALCALPAASLAAPVAEALKSEGPAAASSEADGPTRPTTPSPVAARADPGSDGRAATPVLSPEEEERQRRLLRATLQRLEEDLAAAREAYRAAKEAACTGRFHPFPLLSLTHSASTLVAKCRSSGQGCLADTTPGDPHGVHCELGHRRVALADAVQRRQRFLARLQLCLLAAEAQRRWTKEAEFRAFLASVGGSDGGLSADDFKHLPKRERQRLEEAWARWREAEAERKRLDELRRQEEEEAARRRREAERRAREAAREALAAAAAAGDVEQLRGALRQAQATGLLDTDPAVESAQQTLAGMTEAMEQLRQALDVDDITALEEAMLKAQVVGLKGELVDKAAARVAQLQAEAEEARARRAREQAKALQELQRAMGAGSPGQLRVALAAAEAAGVEDLEEARSCLTQLVEAQEALREAVASGDFSSLQDAVAAARALGLDAEELQTAVAMLEEIRRRRQEEVRASEEQEAARRALRAAIASGSINDLQMALNKALDAGLPDAECQECRGLVKRLKRIKLELQEAMASRNLAQLERMLAAAKSAGLQDNLLGDVEALVARLRAEDAQRRKALEEEKRRVEQERRRKQLEEEMRRKREEEERRRRAQEAEDRRSGKVPVQKLNIEELLRTVPPGGHYTDPDFTPAKALTKKNLKWQRLPDFMKQPQLVEKGMTPDDIGQGALGDCWFLSAMACAAGVPRCLDPVFVHADVEKGLYVVRLYKNGVFRDVAVDDMIPTTYGRPSFAKSRTCQNEVWVTVLEKAYAKVHGSYDAIEGGFVSDGLCDLTGGIGDAMQLGSEATKQAINDGSLWAKMKQLRDDGHMLGSGSHSGSDTDISSQGIVQGHAYSILRVEEVDGKQLLQLRNPWGDTEWKGRWSDKDTASWTQRMRAKLDYKDDDDGTFWMAFGDFVNHYSTLYICRVLGDAWQRKYAAGAWRGASAGGCSNFDSFGNNPVFRLQLAKRVRLLLVLEQRDARGTDSENFYIAFSLYRDRGGRRQPCSFANSGSYRNRRSVCIEAEVEPGSDGPHYVIATTFDPGEETDFSLVAYWRGDPGDVSFYPEKAK